MPSPIAHVAMGYAIYQLGRPRTAEQAPAFLGMLPRLALVTAGLSMLPDLDAIPGIVMGDLKLFHNNISHSLGFAVIAACLIASLVWFKQRTGFIYWFLLTFTSYTMHVVLDFFTRGRGVMILWPLSAERYEPGFNLFHGLRWSRGFPGAFEPLTIVTELAFVGIVLVSIHVLPVILAGLRRRYRAREIHNDDVHSVHSS